MHDGLEGLVANRRILGIAWILERPAVFAALIFALAAPWPCTAAADGEAPAGRPRIGLVLGGGGARGAAHVGVLKVLEEMRIPVDVVVGTSMGSIVGGLYASGMTPQQIEHELETMDWDGVFQDAPARADRSFRRKQDDVNYAFKAKLGVTSEGKLSGPLGFIRGQKFDLALNRLTQPVADVTNFDELHIPFRAVATDLETGKEVVLGSGSLPRAIRASMAVPGAFDPVDIDGRLLVDGGLSDNVPINVARAMGADQLIVVDVGSGLASRNEIHTVLDVTAQLVSILFTLNTEEQLKSLGPQDVLLRPQLGDIKPGDFKRVGDAIPTGERSARQQIPALAHFSLPPEAYKQHIALRGQRHTAPPVIQFVRIDNKSSISDGLIRARISAEPGKPLDVAQLEKDIDRVYGLDIFESVRYSVVQEEGKTGLVIDAKEKSWGPGYLQFGLATSNNFKGDNVTRFGVLYRRTAINSLNGELRAGLQLGDEPLISTEIYQPLDERSRYFVAGKIQYSEKNFNTFDKDGRNLARYRVESHGIELAGGRELGLWGEARVGYRWSPGTAHVTTGNPAAATDINQGELFARLSADKLDNPYFPRSGYFGRIEYRDARREFGSSADYKQVDLAQVYARSWGEHTLIGGAIVATSFDGTAPVGALYRLGGFLRLSGLQEDQLSGPYAGLLSLTYLRRLYNTQIANAYVGANAQVGNVWQHAGDVSLNNSIWSGSLFVGAGTPIGPVYLGYGVTDRQQRSLYLMVGPRFTF
ncbi:MAG: Patatin [Rhodocyclaceae bacterium]|nr:Patatin [Rhodocyclaceae bacterium]